MDGAGDWYCASFDATPDIGLLRGYRPRLGPDVSMFFVRDAANRFTLLVPPNGAKFVRAVNAAGELPPFASCDKAADDGQVQILFGPDADLQDHFPKSFAAKAARTNRG